MDIVIITDKNGVYIGVCSYSLQLWAERYQAKNGYVGTIIIDYEYDLMIIGTQTFNLIYESL